jgi:hypothetical protein
VPGHALKNVQVNLAVLATRAKRQVLMHDGHGSFSRQPRKITQAFLQCVPVPTEVSGKSQFIRQIGKQLPLATNAGWDTDDNAGCIAKARWLFTKHKPRRQGRGLRTGLLTFDLRLPTSDLSPRLAHGLSNR